MSKDGEWQFAALLDDESNRFVDGVVERSKIAARTIGIKSVSMKVDGERLDASCVGGSRELRIARFSTVLMRSVEYKETCDRLL